MVSKNKQAIIPSNFAKVISASVPSSIVIHCCNTSQHFITILKPELPSQTSKESIEMHCNV